MPWCDECDQLVEEEEVGEEYTCPTCGNALGDPPHRRVPAYFKFMLTASVIYLGYRAYQGIAWLAHHL
ncbi:MAG TPA: hypothetical protein VGL60_07155 [Acidimicrobiales bacterium]|jgi:hypothetical protein